MGRRAGQTTEQRGIGIPHMTQKRKIHIQNQITTDKKIGLEGNIDTFHRPTGWPYNGSMLPPHIYVYGPKQKNKFK